jgi:RNA binding exosome subunit
VTIDVKWLWRVLSQIPIAYVDIRFFAHATEDVDKVIEAVRHVLPSDHVEDIVFNKGNLRGHYGNSITLFEAKIKDKETIRALVENLFSHLSELDKETLSREIQLHVEKGSLYIRLDKQAALQGKLKFCTSDPIHIRIRFRKTKIEDVIRVCRELGMLT